MKIKFILFSPWLLKSPDKTRHPGLVLSLRHLSLGVAKSAKPVTVWAGSHPAFLRF